MNRERFRFFPLTIRESDLLIGVPHRQFEASLLETSHNELVRIRKIIERQCRELPAFATSLEPLSFPSNPSALAPEIRTMLECGQKTGTGPMSAVAGLVAEKMGISLAKQHKLEEVVVENGGDLYLRNQIDLVVVIHAGSSPLSDKLAFSIPPGKWGICTSSGTFGHSFSLGNADAVTIIARSAPLADSWATALANRVKTDKDIELVLDRVSEIPDILGCAIILGDRIGVRGAFELKLLS